MFTEPDADTRESLGEFHPMPFKQTLQINLRGYKVTVFFMFFFPVQTSPELGHP